MRRATTFLALAGSIAMMAAAPPGYSETSDQFYLRGTGCGATENAYLMQVSGPDELDGCGGAAGLPFNEVFHHAIDDDPTAFPTTTAFGEIIVDGTRNLTGTITAEQWLSGTVSAGQVIVEGRIFGQQSGKTVTLGTFSQEKIKSTPTGSIAFALDIDLDDAISLAPFTDITIEVKVRGVSMNNSNLALEGASHFTIPTLVAVPTATAG